MRYTIGYIKHNEEVHSRYLGPSLESLLGEFDIISTSDEKSPAANYNDIIDQSPNDWIILCHQDISFSNTLILELDYTLSTLNAFDAKVGCLGIVGHTFNESKYDVKWSEPDDIYLLETCDCCFIVINKSNGLRFDQDTFDDFHLYVEDYCIQAQEFGGVYTIRSNASEGTSINTGKYISHHSATVTERGTAWGRYWEYKDILNKKWSRIIKTT